jgi:hypothetical protein
MSDILLEKKDRDSSSVSSPIVPDEKGPGRNAVSLGWVAFFGGMAQDMIQPILPVFLHFGTGPQQRIYWFNRGFADHCGKPDEDWGRLPFRSIGCPKEIGLHWVCSICHSSHL